jgi:hypothetical protein
LVLDLEIARAFIQNKLQEKAMTHLYIRTQSKSLVICSMEREGEAVRALLTGFPEEEFSLCIANPRGDWQLVPLVGGLPEIMTVLTDTLGFALAVWPDKGLRKRLP